MCSIDVQLVEEVGDLRLMEKDNDGETRHGNGGLDTKAEGAMCNSTGSLDGVICI